MKNLEVDKDKKGDTLYRLILISFKKQIIAACFGIHKDLRRPPSYVSRGLSI